MFGALLMVDFLVNLASAAGVSELQPLLSLWTGPLDDIFYGITGVQALYYLVDPEGETREAPVMGWLDTVKKIFALLSLERYRRTYLPATFFTGSLRAVGLLGDALLVTVVASALAPPSAGLTAALVMLQRHLSSVLPVALLIGLGLLSALRARPQKLWGLALLGGLGALVVSMAYDGRWANHVHHLLAALSHLQSWGAAFCWIGAAASVPLAGLRVDPLQEEKTLAQPV